MPLLLPRRRFLAATGLLGATLAHPARAQGLPPTPTMSGGANNYVPRVPLVERLGSGFWVTGSVRRAGDGAPLKGVRIQIWAATTMGGVPDPATTAAC
jgi:hypothetical protein